MATRDGVDRDRWDRAHAASDSPTLARIRRKTLTAALPEGVEPTTVWPAWPLERLLDELEVGDGDILVDLGCGRGEIGLWIASHGGARLVGVDPSPVGLARGRGRARVAGDGDAGFVQALVQRTGLRSASADAALCVDVMHFVESDRAAALREVARVLQTGRRLVTVGPERTDPTRDLRASGFDVEVREETREWRERVLAYGSALRREVASLRAELGPATADELLSRPQQAVAQMTWHGITAARVRGR